MKENLKFCQEPSKAYLKMLENCGGDPRSVVGRHAINKAGSIMERGWFPTWDARDLRAQIILMAGK